MMNRYLIAYSQHVLKNTCEERKPAIKGRYI